MDSKLQERCIDFLIQYRYLLAAISLGFTIIFAIPAKHLYFEADYTIYFEKDEPQLVAHEEMQDTYTKSDNLAIILHTVPERK